MATLGSVANVANIGNAQLTPPPGSPLQLVPQVRYVTVTESLYPAYSYSPTSTYSTASTASTASTTLNASSNLTPSGTNAQQNYTSKPEPISAKLAANAEPSARSRYSKTVNPRKYKCKLCSRSFTTSGHLARHNRIHTGVKNHVCPFDGCNARFSRQDNCMQHYKTHLNVKKSRRR